MSSNIGLTYYKTYFEDLCFDLEKGVITKDGFANDTLFSSNLNNLGINFANLDELRNSKIDDLDTCYPGLLAGAGYAHEIGGMEDELKLGFFFDHTTGLPCIPGSSVKGVLRSACEADKGNYIKYIIDELASGKRVSSVTLKAVSLASDPVKIIVEHGQKYSELVLKVFEGKGMEPYKREVFFDAFPIHSTNENGKFLDNDYITHHESPIKDPNPVQFMKILPGVTFRFDFRLNNEVIDADLKLELFRQIILDLGIGAKTNVGYGQFIPTGSIRHKKDENIDGFIQPNVKIEENKGNTSNWNIPSKAIPYLKKNNPFDGQVIRQEGDYFFIEFIVNDEICSIKKKSTEKVQLSVGQSVRLICANDYMPDNPNISVKKKD